MICKYFAEDGTEFNDYDECEAYERRLTKWSKITESKFYDADEKPMTADEWLSSAEMCAYMEVATDEEAELIQEYCVSEVGLCHPWPNRADIPTAGRYYYSHADDAWHNLDTEIAWLAQITKIFEG